jgi:hypothetical protein
VEWSLDGPLPKLCPTSNQDGHQAKNRKSLVHRFRGEDLNVIFYQNMPNLHNRYKSAERIFKIVSDSPCPPFKMAAVTKNRNFFNCPLLLYYKPN